MESMRSEIQTLKAQQAEQQREIVRLRAQLDAAQGRAVASAGSGSASQSSAPVPSSSPLAGVPSPNANPNSMARSRSARNAKGQPAAEANADAASGSPHVPDNLRVVFVAPEPVEYNDDNTPNASRRSRPVGTPEPLNTETSLKEPVNMAAVDASTSATAAANPPLDAAAIEVEYKVALASPDAADKLEQFARKHPEHPSADNALFEAGLRAERTGDAERARSDFEKAVQEHPAGDVVADAMLHLAACDLQLHRTGAARTVLEKLSAQFPDSAQAVAARARLADLQ
jgi:TolA-binding protein